MRRGEIYAPPGLSFALGNISKFDFHAIHTGGSRTHTGVCPSGCDGAWVGSHQLGASEGGLGRGGGTELVLGTPQARGPGRRAPRK